MAVTDWQLVGLTQNEDGTLTTVDGDPQMILKMSMAAWCAPSATPRNLTAKRGKCACTTPQRSAKITLPTAGCFPERGRGAVHLHAAPHQPGCAAAGPCSPEENKTVTLAVRDITLNAADTLPAVWQYFVPTWYQAFCLVLYPTSGGRRREHDFAVLKKKNNYGMSRCFTLGGASAFFGGVECRGRVCPATIFGKAFHFAPSFSIILHESVAFGILCYIIIVNVWENVLFGRFSPVLCIGKGTMSEKRKDPDSGRFRNEPRYP